MNETIIHLSGACIRIEGGHAIQRCSLCGAALVNSEASRMMVLGETKTMTVDDISSFPVGEFIEVDAGNPTRFSVLPTSDKLPANCCYNLGLT